MSADSGQDPYAEELYREEWQEVNATCVHLTSGELADVLDEASELPVIVGSAH